MLWIFKHFFSYKKFASPKTGGFMGIGNWFRPKSYTKQNHYVRRVQWKKPYSIWIKNKKVIQKVNLVDKLEIPYMCTFCTFLKLAPHTSVEKF